MGEVLAARLGRASFESVRDKRSSAYPALRQALEALRARPTATAGVLLAGLAVGAVSWNALAAQTRRHPAPLFASKAPPVPRAAIVAARPAPPSPPAIAAAPRIPPREAPGEITRSIEPAVLRPAPAKPLREPAARDPIGDVLRSEPAAPPRPEALKEVAAAQRALAKLGYGPLKSDGMMGTTTRQAIERFEKDKRLPVTGELGPRTARLLAAQAGSAPD